MSISGINNHTRIALPTQLNEVVAETPLAKPDFAQYRQHQHQQEKKYLDKYFHKANGHNNKNPEMARALADKDNAYHGAEFGLRLKNQTLKESKSTAKKNGESIFSEEEESIISSETSITLRNLGDLSQLNLSEFQHEFGGYYPHESLEGVLSQLTDYTVGESSIIERFLTGSCQTSMQQYLSLVRFYNHILAKEPNSLLLAWISGLLNEIELKKSGYLHSYFNQIVANQNVATNQGEVVSGKVNEFLASYANFEINNISLAQLVGTIEAIGKLLEDDFEKMTGIYAQYALTVLGKKRTGVFSENDNLFMHDMDFMRSMFLVQSIYHSSKNFLTEFDINFAELKKAELLKKLTNLPEGLVTLNSLQNLYNFCQIMDPLNDSFALFVKRLHTFYRNSAIFASGIKPQAKDKLLFDLIALRSSLDAQSNPKSALNIVSHAKKYMKYA